MYDTVFSIFKYKNNTIYKIYVTDLSIKMTQFIKMCVTVLYSFKYKNDTIYKNACHT